MKAGSVTDRVARVLFNYRITPQTPTGLSPARLNDPTFLSDVKGYSNI